jgi:hypothetical protein
VLSSRSVHLDAKIHGAYFFRKLAVKPVVGSRRPQIEIVNCEISIVPTYSPSRSQAGASDRSARAGNTTQV